MSLASKRVGYQEIDISRVLEVKSGRYIYPLYTKDLEEDIRAHGLLEPIVVEEMKNGYRVLAGGRRYFACKFLGMQTVPAIVYRGLTREERIAVVFAENMKRMEFSVIELARLFEEYKSLNHTPEEIAEAFKLSVEDVQQYLYIAEKTPEGLRRAIAKHGAKLSLEECVLLVKLAESGAPEDEVKRYCEDLATKRINTSMLRSIVLKKLPPIQAKPQVSASPTPQPVAQPAAQPSPQPTEVPQQPPQAAPQQSVWTSQAQPVQEAAPVQAAPATEVKKEAAPEPAEVYTILFEFRDRAKYDVVYDYFLNEEGNPDSEKLYKLVAEKLGL